MNILAIAAIVAGSVLIVAVVALAVGDYLLVARLRRNHPATWQSLGSPSPWFTKPDALIVFNRFLAQRLYEDLADPDLVKLAGRLRLLTNLLYWIAGAVLLLIGAARLRH